MSGGPGLKISLVICLGDGGSAELTLSPSPRTSDGEGGPMSDQMAMVGEDWNPAK